MEIRKTSQSFQSRLIRLDKESGYINPQDIKKVFWASGSECTMVDYIARKPKKQTSEGFDEFIMTTAYPGINKFKKITKLISKALGKSGKPIDLLPLTKS